MSNPTRIIIIGDPRKKCFFSMEQQLEMQKIMRSIEPIIIFDDVSFLNCKQQKENDVE